MFITNILWCISIQDSLISLKSSFEGQFFLKKTKEGSISTEQKIRTEIKTTNISFKQLIISFKRYNKSLNRYEIEWKLKQENQNGH